MSAPAGSGGVGLDGTGTEHQRRDVERQDDQRQQRPWRRAPRVSAAGDAADQAQGRRAEQKTQRSE